MNKYIIIAIYILGLCVTAWYVLGSSYLSVPDASREYYLYNMLRSQSYWSLHGHVEAQYNLQLSCIFTTLLPARISQIIPISPELFYKLYTIFILPLVPVMVYILARKFTDNIKSIISALFVIGWVGFLQGASQFRTGFALLFYTLALILIFSSGRRVMRYIGIILAGLLLPLAHYTTAFITVCLIGGVILLSLVFNKSRWEYRKSLLIFLLPLFVMTVTWCIFGAHINFLWVFIGVSRLPGNYNYDSAVSSVLGLGVHGAVGYILFALGWFTIILIAVGLLSLRRNNIIPVEYKSLSILSFFACVPFIILPFLNGAYGITRLYYQAIITIGLIFSFGVGKLAGLLRIRPAFVGFPLVLIYAGLMKSYCLINAVAQKI